MVQRKQIRRWCDIVAQEFRPQKIILFGSYAEGNATEDSDVDILVVLPRVRGTRDVHQAAAIRQRVRAPFPMDVIVKSPQEIARCIAGGDGFISGIIRNGELMYEGKRS